MRVGQVDRIAESDLWLYRIPHHKTEKKVKWKKVIPFGKPEQAILEPFLVNKEPDAAVFSPQQAMDERRTAKRANRQLPLPPAHKARDAAREPKPSRYRELYNKDSYRTAVARAIERANRDLPDDEKIPYWTPYQIRHTASSAMEVEVGFDESQVLLDHETPSVTARYNHRRLQKLKELARNRRNPFDMSGQAEREPSK
jgi:integrase